MAKRVLKAVKLLNASAKKGLRETVRGMTPDLVVSRTHHVRLGVGHVLDPHHVIVVDSLITERTTATLVIGLEGHVSVTHVASMNRQRCGFLQLVHETSAPHGEAAGSVPHVRHDQGPVRLQPLRRNLERTNGRRVSRTRNPVLVRSTFLQSLQQADMMITEPLQVLHRLIHNYLHEVTARLGSDFTILGIGAGFPSNTHASRPSKRQMDLFRSVPVLGAAAGGCGVLARTGGRIGNALVVIVRNGTGQICCSHGMTTKINSTPVALVGSRDLVIHTAAALHQAFTRHVCAPCLAKPDAQKKHKMTERSHCR